MEYNKELLSSLIKNNNMMSKIIIRLSDIFDDWEFDIDKLSPDDTKIFINVFYDSESIKDIINISSDLSFLLDEKNVIMLTCFAHTEGLKVYYSTPELIPDDMAHINGKLIIKNDIAIEIRDMLKSLKY